MENYVVAIYILTINTELDDAYEFYCDYAKMVGFNVKKNTSIVVCL
jgi:hypothetical protein